MKAALTLAVAFLPSLAAAQSVPHYKLDARGAAVVEVSGMGTSDCSPGKRPIHGRVANRTFQDGGLVPAGFVVETSNGERTNVNTFPDLDRLPMVDRGWIVTGLQHLTRIGARVVVDAVYCGAAGRVIMADRIRAR